MAAMAPMAALESVIGDDDIPGIIIDNGTHRTKMALTRRGAGKYDATDPKYASYDEAAFISPRTPTDGTHGGIITMPTIMGRPRQGRIPGMGARDGWVGNEAEAKRSLLTLKNPMQNGYMTNWDDTEKIWHQCFYNELRVAPEEHPVMLTNAPLTTRSSRERITQIMFETYNVPVMYIGNSALLSLFASGRTTGIVVNSGDGCTHIVPIYNGRVLEHAILRGDIAGDEITSHLLNQMCDTERYSSWIPSTPYAPVADSVHCLLSRDIIRGIKDKLCSISSSMNDYDINMKNAATSKDEHKYILPDGNTITIPSTILCRVSESMFQPSLVATSFDEKSGVPISSIVPTEIGITQLIYNSIMKCCNDDSGNMWTSSDELRSELWNNIILSGGNTLMNGFVARLERELNRMIPLYGDIAKRRAAGNKGSGVRIIAANDRINSACIGGAILSSMPSFQHLWISKQEYDETGPSIIHPRRPMP